MSTKTELRVEKMKNRYGDEFVFTLLEDNNVQMEGEFGYMRCGFPNDYTESYKAYVTNGGLLSLSEFKEEVHRSLYSEDDRYIGPSPIAEKYQNLVVSRTDIINMIDPSGGPYLSEGQTIMGKIIKEFKSNEKGYLIITK